MPDLVFAVLKAAKSYSNSGADLDRYSRLSSTMVGNGESLEQRLMPFQREGVQEGLRMGGRMLLGDEMGLVGRGCVVVTAWDMGVAGTAWACW